MDLEHADLFLADQVTLSTSWTGQRLQCHQSLCTVSKISAHPSQEEYSEGSSLLFLPRKCFFLSSFRQSMVSVYRDINYQAVDDHCNSRGTPESSSPAVVSMRDLIAEAEAQDKQAKINAVKSKPKAPTVKAMEEKYKTH